MLEAACAGAEEVAEDREAVLACEVDGFLEGFRAECRSLGEENQDGIGREGGDSFFEGGLVCGPGAFDSD